MVTTRHDVHQDVAGFAELTEKFDELNQKAAALAQARAQQAQFDELTRKIEQLTRTAMAPQHFEELLSKVDALTHKVEQLTRKGVALKQHEDLVAKVDALTHKVDDGKLNRKLDELHRKVDAFTTAEAPKAPAKETPKDAAAKDATKDAKAGK